MRMRWGVWQEVADGSLEYYIIVTSGWRVWIKNVCAKGLIVYYVGMVLDWDPSHAKKCEQKKLFPSKIAPSFPRHEEKIVDFTVHGQ